MSVRISKPLQPGLEEAVKPPKLALAKTWLGAKSPFGLALPSAQPTASQLYGPRGVWLDGQRLIVCDSGNHRIMIWNQVPAEDETPADIVLGQPDFESEGPNAAGRGPENGVHLPTGVLVAEGRLVVADAWNHRILVWNRIPTSNDQQADYVIGQDGFSNTEVNRGANPSSSSLYWPYGIGWVAGRFYVADTGNRRVLAWNGFPEANQPADVVIGQANFNVNEENRGSDVAADSFRWSHDICGDADQVFIADAGNHRVLRWKTHPESDRPADSVLGQSKFDSAYELPYDAQGPARLRFPYAIDQCDNVLAVADTANNRVLFWKLPLSEEAGTSAMDVIGQLDFGGNGENGWKTIQHDTLCWPYGISFHNGFLAVADSGNNRVVIWDARPVLEAAQK